MLIARLLHIVKRLVLATGVLLLLSGVLAAAPPVAVFPLQDLSGGKNEVNLPFTKLLEERLKQSGNAVVDLGAVITYMAKSRIRRVGSLESSQVRQVQQELGAAYVLIGTIVQRKERPSPTLGLTLNLLSTSNARPIWTYVGALSQGDYLKMLGVGEPQNTADLEKVLLAEVISQWPWDRMTDLQQGSIALDSFFLEPRDIQPGGEIRCRVRLSDAWRGDGSQQIFFQVGDQLFPAVARKDDDHVYEAAWIAGEENGRIPVNLLMRWPQYERTETALIGSYFVDNVPPLLELDFAGTQIYEGVPVFFSELVILPKMLVRKPLARWRLAFFPEGGTRPIGEMEEEGPLPESFVWKGTGSQGDGKYKVLLEVWDLAGNLGQAYGLVEMNRRFPQVDFLLEKKNDGMVVDLAYAGKIPIKYWRLEVWTNEGKILTQREGSEFPATIDIDLEDASQYQDLDGILLYQDVLGKKVRRRVKNLLPKITEEKKEDEDDSLSKSWVDDF